MVVLSLFDGMSCGQIALRELGAKITDYPGLVQMAVQQDATVQNAGQWLDGRSNQAYTFIFA